ncbi:MAG: D-aminoacyl-tRNA deacylase [Desulfobacterales bacterium]
MRAVVQRVTEGVVMVGGREVGRIGRGMLVLLGVHRQDTVSAAEALAHKVSRLRIFEDAGHKMNRSLIDTGGQMLVVSQFTLYGDCRKGRRPSFVEAAMPALARQLYECFAERVRREGITVETGLFGEMMAVQLVNDGPVTLILDSVE